jgi:caffeoyl-CoA O-methyltransferase
MPAFILEKSIEKYLDRLNPPRDGVLTEMELRAKRERIPIVGPTVGRLLALLVHMERATRIFEMGSAIGYSTIWLARAAGPRAEVHYSDSDTQRAADAKGYFRRAGVLKRVTIHIGDAVKLLQATKGTFDLIFCDIDKAGYPDAFRRALPKLRRGGLLVADNVLWSGKVTGAAKDDSTRGIQEFNRLIFSSQQLLSVIVPLRDGVAVCRKR